MKQYKFECKYWVYSRNSGFELAETKGVNNLVAARVWANCKLAGQSIETTNDCYWRDTGRMNHVDINSTECLPDSEYGKNVPKYRETVEPYVYIVPSVGELGYTP